MPKSNQEFWATKLAANVARDEKNQAALKSLGWRVIVVWECEASVSSILRRVLARITKAKA
jgi:DNA mismatch endonuclease (patch repair protein)